MRWRSEGREGGLARWTEVRVNVGVCGGCLWALCSRRVRP